METILQPTPISTKYLGTVNVNGFDILYDNTNTDIDYDDFITKDDTPVDMLSGFIQSLLISSLYDAKHLDKPFLAMSNVGLFYHPDSPPIVPDVMVCLDTQTPNGAEIWDAKYAAYFLWARHKAPDIVVEIVSDLTPDHRGRAIGTHFDLYAAIGVPYYVVLDYKRQQEIRPDTVIVYELVDGAYVARSDTRMEKADMALTFQRSHYSGLMFNWLR
ncbi:MAG: Uma2 family endonuclease [Chloroflexota bacterium]